MSIPMIEELALSRTADMRRQPRGPLASEVRSNRRAAAGHGRRWSLHRRAH